MDDTPGTQAIWYNYCPNCRTILHGLNVAGNYFVYQCSVCGFRPYDLNKEDAERLDREKAEEHTVYRQKKEQDNG